MIYFIRSPDGTIKIGTTIRLSERLQQLAADYGGGLELLAVVEGGFDEEQSLHRRFEHLKVRRIFQCEWFRPGDDLLAFIRDQGKEWDGSDEEPSNRQKNVVALRGTEEWKVWLDGLAEANHAPVTVTIEQALRELADRLKVRKPPRRLP